MINSKAYIRFSDLINSLIAIILALLLGALLIFVSGYDVANAYRSLFDGAFGGVYNIAQTLLKMIPLIFTGLAVAIAFQCGLFNIGAEGQMYWGAFGSAIAAIAFPGTPAVILLPLSLFAGAVA